MLQEYFRIIIEILSTQQHTLYDTSDLFCALKTKNKSNLINYFLSEQNSTKNLVKTCV